GCRAGRLRVVAYERDILDEFAEQRRRPTYRRVEAELGIVVEDRSSGFVGDIVRWSAAAVTLRDRRQQLRHFGWKEGGFLLAGIPVTLVRPTPQASREHTTRSRSGALVDRRAAPRTAAASRIWVEGIHDAELLELVWGDELREAGIVVEPLHG